MNILGVIPYEKPVIDIITHQILKALDKNSKNESHIEIQFKYAQFTGFCNSDFLKEPLNFIPDRETKQKVIAMSQYFIFQQNKLHFDTLKKLSKHELLYLNPLGRRVYKLYGGFDENKNKKFYKIREFLLKLCKQNQQAILSKINFYYQLQNISQNKTFQVINQNEIRLDLNIKKGQYAGRYSYLVGKGWTKVVKQTLIKEQFDLMINQKTIRLGIKKQKQTEQSFEQVLTALSNQNSEKGQIFLRLKRALRVSKNGEVEIALSQIYQPQLQLRQQYVSDVKDMLGLQHQVLDEFCKNVFQQFYMTQQKPSAGMQELISKYQIESQFLPKGLEKIQEYSKNKRYDAISRFVMTTFEDLYSLSFVDHRMKSLQAKTISEMVKQKHFGDYNYPQCRLENEYGSYMHDLVYEYITNSS